MVHSFVDCTFRQTNLSNESEEYLHKREELRLAEINLMQEREQVAALRRELPQGGTLEEYAFLEGPTDLWAGDEPIRTVKLSELFTAPNRALVVYQIMLGKKQLNPCPMCTLWIDGYNGVAQHLAKNMDFVIVAAVEPEVLQEYAPERGWHTLRLLSAGSSTFKYDLGSEGVDGAQDSAIAIFTKDADGSVPHIYTAQIGMSKRDVAFAVSPSWHSLCFLSARTVGGAMTGQDISRRGHWQRISGVK